MEKMHFSIIIKAPREKVWNTMLDDETYRKWTEPFTTGSRYEGNWSEGSKILFLAPGEKGDSGMVSRIRENRLHEFISIEHLGMITDGIEDTTSDAVKTWSGAREEYRFRDVDGGTEVLVDTDTTDEYREMFETVWPKALLKLKELAEEHKEPLVKKRPKSKTRVTARRKKAKR